MMRWHYEFIFPRLITISVVIVGYI